MEPSSNSLRQGLPFLATTAFLASFFGSRLFTTACSTCIIEGGGIHFHLFWYGILLLGLVGWLSIMWKRSERLNRTYALLYGLGVGLIGDEVGLLLTFGNYQSELTYEVFIASFSLVVIAYLLRYGKGLAEDIVHFNRREWLTLLGVFLVGFSVILYTAAPLSPGAIVTIIGAAIFLLGLERQHLRQKIGNIRNRKT